MTGTQVCDTGLVHWMGLCLVMLKGEAQWEGLGHCGRSLGVYTTPQRPWSSLLVVMPRCELLFLCCAAQCWSQLTMD